MKYLFLPMFMLLVCALCTAQAAFTVQDTLTKQPLPYVSVNLLNGYGVFSDEKGLVTIADAAVKEVGLSCLGYKPKTLALQGVSPVVNLQPQPLQLEEVVILASKKVKRKVKETKPKGHQDNSYLYMSSTALQYAFLVEAKEPESYLTGIALPLMEIAFEAEGNTGIFEPVPFKTLVKIEVLQNANGQPGVPLAGFEQLAEITNAQSLKRFDIAFNEEIAVPAGGLFVQLTILGRATADGALTPEPGYTAYKGADGETRLWMKHCQPNFPLVERPKGPMTFIKEPFADNAWKSISRPHLHNNGQYPDMNIPFGYTLAVYK
jgi:hypothetical protein